MRERSPVALAVFIGFLLFCPAGATCQTYPDTPPEIVFTTPEEGADGISLTTRIGFQFSENMNESSVEEAFSISPYEEIFDFYWDSGDFVSVTFMWDLELNTSYTVTIDNTATDSGGERLEKDFVLNFTTEGGQTGDEDWDYDGIPDAWEYEHFDTIIYDGWFDNDGDGFNNLEEYESGTDPTDPNSHPPKDMTNEFLMAGVIATAISVLVFVGYWFMKQN